MVGRRGNFRFTIRSVWNFFTWETWVYEFEWTLYGRFPMSSTSARAYTGQGVATVVEAQFVTLVTAADVLIGTSLINNVVFRLAGT